jgi:hypothetical protein
MGVVYEVHDRVRDEVVALKTLLRARPTDIYRLKREFRSLVDVAHPNLVSLYELVVDGADCFFTMELVNGVNLVEYVRRPEATPSVRAERVRHVFRQLVEGIGVLHRTGKLHRDIKPSNILVTPAGRVVILDFGLAGDIVPDDAAISETMAGTPAYLAPERRKGTPASEGHDWYGVGVTLYAALTGRVPFEGRGEDVLRRKREADPCPPAEIAPDIPGDLDAICTGLLRRDPALRMTGQEAARLLGNPAATVGVRAFSTDANPPFVGRRQQLAALESALTQARRGTATALYVYGPSGIGKSALVQYFLDRVVSREEIVALRGRCYEYESVPFNAFDGIIDNLSRLLSALPPSPMASLPSTDLTALSRLFPVMLQVEAAVSAGGAEPPQVDPVILRQRAFAELRQLLARLAARQPLVIYIDDLHWADADSVVLLEELLRQPNAPGLLLIACLRTEELASKPFLRALLDRTKARSGTLLPIEPLTDDEARALLACAETSDARGDSEEWQQIARDAGGNPFLLRQLARYVAADSARRRRVTFAEMLDEGVGALPRDGRRFLETLAICGRPVAPDIVFDACGVTRDRQSLLARLRASHFIRSSGSSERVETYHDRIREALAARIAPGDARQIHGRMVQALVERGSDDGEALFDHYRGAGDDDNASLQAGLAAAKAQGALAFDRAAWFYREALALAPDTPFAAAWREGLAAALANAGQPAAAADAYLRAAADAIHPHRVEPQRRAAEQFLIAGDLDRGLGLTRAILSGIGMRAPRTRREALAWLLWRRARLRWRGLRFVPQPVEAIDSETLLRIDTCWAAATGLSMVDFIEASEFNIRDLQMALDAGDAYRIARAMAIESAARVASPRTRAFGERLSRTSKALAQRIGNPHAIALSDLADAITAMMSGRFKSAATFAEQAVAILRDQCVGVTWELNTAQNLAVWGLLYQGELVEVSRRLHALLAGARRSGNLFVATELCTRGSHVWLAADDPDEGERIVIESLARWSRGGYNRQHYSAILSRIQIALYRGDAEGAWRLLDDLKSVLKQTYLRRVQFMRIEACNLRARSALAMAAAHRTAGRFQAVARAEAQRIAAERMPWSDPIALMLQGGIAFLDGNRPLALRYFHDAADRFERADMRLHAAAARRRIGALQDDDNGRHLQRQAEAWMATQQIKNPAGMTRMLAPGLPDVG